MSSNVKLTNRASESHETYTFLYKVYEESNKMINDMLAKKSMEGKTIGMYNISIRTLLILLKQKEPKKIYSYRSKKRPKSWNEKLAIKRKENASRKKKKPQDNLVIYA